MEVRTVVRQAHARLAFNRLLADAGYDGEPLHVYLESLGIEGIIPPRRGRPPRADRLPSGPHRARLARNWPRDLYGQRWQVETGFSMLKRLLGSAVRSRRPHAINREILLRVLTINLMILWRRLILSSFQQSRLTMFNWTRIRCGTWVSYPHHTPLIQPPGTKSAMGRPEIYPAVRLLPIHSDTALASTVVAVV